MKVKFEGYLAEMYPQGVDLEADTIAGALKGLSYFPGISGATHIVAIDGFDNPEFLFLQAKLPEITLRPVLVGAGGGGGGKQLLIGAFLIALAVAMPGSLANAGMFTKALFYTGMSMAIGGAIQLLMPAPKSSASSSGTGSLFFSSTKNTVKIGTPIPLIVGRAKVYGQYLSFNVNAKDYAPA